MFSVEITDSVYLHMTIRNFCFSLLLICCSGALATPAHEKALKGPVFERRIFIGVQASKLWQALTDPIIVEKYSLAPLQYIEKKRGGKIYYGSKSKRVIEGMILKYSKGRELVHTFSFSHRPEDPPSRVSYTVTPMGMMSLLHLRHDQFPSANGTFADVTEGWDIILSSLKTLVETGKPLPWPKAEVLPTRNAK